MSELSHQQIKERAYQLWQAEGNVPGNDMHYWLKAEAELRGELLSPSAPAPTTPTTKKAAKPKAGTAASHKTPAKPKKATTSRARKAPSAPKPGSAPTP